jgi:RNA-binding protein YhbY
MTQGQVQLGKQGITENFIATLKHHFNRHNNVKVHVLKSAGHNKEDIKKYMGEIVEKLGKHYSAKTIGFSIFIKKWRRAVR